MKRWLLLALAFLALLAAGQERPVYTVRLFWQSVPPAIEVAPLLPFSPKAAPRLQLADGREIYLRGPLRVSQEGSRLALGGKYRDFTDSFTSKSPLRLRVEGGGWGQLEGELRVWVAEGQLELEIRMDREAYTRAVLAGEGGGLREPEALKALAVCIRSYAFNEAGRHKAEGFDFCDTTHCQDLRLASRHETVDAAVDETTDELLWKDGKPVPAFHHADSGGHTEDARVVWGNDAPGWMTGRADPYSAGPPVQKWRAEIKQAELEKALLAEGISTGPLDDLAVTARSDSGRATEVRAGGRTIPASTLRFAVGRQLDWNKLRSDLYTVSRQGDVFLFEGKGNGHGVGLSQRGAATMARDGKGYREILAFYFHGARVGVNAQDIEWRMLRSGRLRFLFAPGGEDTAFPSLAEAELNRLESETGFRLRREVTIRVYPTLDLYRNYSGFDGHTAGALRAREIHLQPLSLLRSRGNLNGTLRHEWMHVLIADTATRPLPLWFEEGLALWMSGESSNGSGLPCSAFSSLAALEEGMSGSADARRRAARSTATRLVAAAARQYGRDAVLGWVRQGPPENDHRLTRLLQQACQSGEE